MPISDAVLSGLGSSLGAMQLAAEAPSGFSYGASAVQDPYMQVQWLNGEDWVPLVLAMSATIVYGVDVVVATASIEFPEDPAIPANSQVQIICGAGVNNVLRFKGIYRSDRAGLWPATFTMICRGMLSLAEQYKQTRWATLPSFIASNARIPIVGQSIFALMNDTEPDDYPTATYNRPPTDTNYVLAVLNQVPKLVVDPADIGGCEHDFGGVQWKELTWLPYTSALAQCQKLDEVCLGYRLFESLAGRIMRVQIKGYPNNISDYTFTEGVDVRSAFGTRSVEELINACYVEGYALGGRPGLINAFVQSSNPFQPEEDPHIDKFSSSLIDTVDFAGEVAEWRLTERNRQLVNVEFTTHRDDLLIPGRTVSILIPHIGVTQPVWLQHVEIRIQSNPIKWEQTGRGLGGGLPEGYDFGTGYDLTPAVEY